MYRQPLCGNTTIAAVLPHVAIPGGALPLQPRFVTINSSNSDSSFDTVTERSNDHMSNRQRNLGINIRVTSQEKKKIERNAKKCRLTVSEYLRQLAMNKEPKELPVKEIEESFLRIGEVISNIDDMKNSSSDPVTQRFCAGIYADLLRIMVETLQLMRHINPKSEVKADGND